MLIRYQLQVVFDMAKMTLGTILSLFLIFEGILATDLVIKIPNIHRQQDGYYRLDYRYRCYLLKSFLSIFEQSMLILHRSIFKRRLVAFKGGFVGPSVCRSVGLSSKNFSKSFEKEVLSIK